MTTLEPAAQTYGTHAPDGQFLRRTASTKPSKRQVQTWQEMILNILLQQPDDKYRSCVGIFNPLLHHVRSRVQVPQILQALGSITMNRTIQERYAEEIEQVVSVSNHECDSRFDSDPFATDASATLIADADNLTGNSAEKLTRQFQPVRFAIGLMCTASGVALILGIGLRIIEIQNVNRDVSTPLIAICVLTGVILLSGGFGVMATSSSGFDDAEFDRLAAADNISAVHRSDPEIPAFPGNLDHAPSAA